MLEFKRKRTLSVLYWILHFELFGENSDEDTLLSALFPQHVRDSEVTIFKCAKCGGMKKVVGEVKFREDQACSLIGNRGKRCGAYRRKNWRPEKKYERQKSFRDSKLKNQYKTNLEKRELDELFNRNLIVKSGEKLFVNYQQVFVDLLSTIDESILHTTKGEIPKFINNSLGSVMNNRELSARIFYCPLFMNKALPEKERRRPQTYGAYLERVRSILANFTDDRNYFEDILKQNFSLINLEIKQLSWLQNLCYREENRRRGDLHSIGNIMWGVRKGELFFEEDRSKFPMKFSPKEKNLKKS